VLSFSYVFILRWKALFLWRTLSTFPSLVFCPSSFPLWCSFVVVSLQFPYSVIGCEHWLDLLRRNGILSWVLCLSLHNGWLWYIQYFQNCSNKPTLSPFWNLGKTLLMRHITDQYLYWVSFTKYLNVWSYNVSNHWLTQLSLCLKQVLGRTVAAPNKSWLSHHTLKLVSNANSKREPFSSILLLRMTRFGGTD
jgi:hypothetical protein